MAEHPTPRCRLLTDGQLHTEISRVARQLDALATRFEALLDERERRGGQLALRLTPAALAWLVCGPNASPDAPIDAGARA